MGIPEVAVAEEYAHLEPGEEIRSVSGYYTMEKELRIEYGGREALVVLGYTIIDNACCGAGGRVPLCAGSGVHY